MKKLLIVLGLAALLPAAHAAMPGSTWDLIMEAHGHTKKAKEKLEQAEKAETGERQKLMQQHMSLMEQAMRQMHTVKPVKDMTMEEHERWISEHQKFMDEVMDQMAREHKLMMEGCAGMAKHAH
ncbi:MAG: hypothetical protein HYV16_02045 [Gammaproteobacteria bacterium]|nr:hypothetical protein [Gammaproteobacteria bacterium]